METIDTSERIPRYYRPSLITFRYSVPHHLQTYGGHRVEPPARYEPREVGQLGRGGVLHYDTQDWERVPEVHPEDVLGLPSLTPVGDTHDFL